MQHAERSSAKRKKESAMTWEGLAAAATVITALVITITAVAAIIQPKYTGGSS